jgi:large subunit ribosomal protein L16
MLLKPKKRSFKKHHRYSPPVTIKRKTHLVYGHYGLVSKEFGLFNAAQMSACIMTIKRALARTGKIWLRAYPHIPVTKKPLEVRMGKGKGGVDHWITKIGPGSVIFEIECPSELVAQTALKAVAKKLPFKTTFIKVD